MALRQGSIKGRASKKEEAFRTHLAIYLCVGLFLLTLNLLTSPFDLWFYWPLFFWGWALVFQAFATYGADAPSRVPEVLRSLVPWIGDAIPTSRPDMPPSRAADAAPFAAEAFAAVHERIERLKELTWRLPDGPVREQAAQISESADLIAATLAANRAAAETVYELDADLLAPAESLLEHYIHIHAASHNSVSGDELRRIEEHDLPHLQSRLDAQVGKSQGSGVVAFSVAGLPMGIEQTAPQGVPLRSQP